MDRLQEVDGQIQPGAVACALGPAAPPPANQPRGAAPAIQPSTTAASFRVLSVGRWQLARVHSALQELAGEGYELWATVEDGAGGLELWLVKQQQAA